MPVAVCVHVNADGVNRGTRSLGLGVGAAFISCGICARKLRLHSARVWTPHALHPQFAHSIKGSPTRIALSIFSTPNNRQRRTSSARASAVSSVRIATGCNRQPDCPCRAPAASRPRHDGTASIWCVRPIDRYHEAQVDGHPIDTEPRLTRPSIGSLVCVGFLGAGGMGGPDRPAGGGQGPAGCDLQGGGMRVHIDRVDESWSFFKHALELKFQSKPPKPQRSPPRTAWPRSPSTGPGCATPSAPSRSASLRWQWRRRRTTRTWYVYVCVHDAWRIILPRCFGGRHVPMGGCSTR